MVPDEDYQRDPAGTFQSGAIYHFGELLNSAIRETRPTVEKISDWTRAAGNALTLGNFNEMVAGADNLLGNRDGVSFNDRLAYEDQQGQLFRQENPTTSTALDLAGGIATPLAMMRGGASFLRNATPAASSIVPRSALEGGAYGAVAGFGAGDADFNIIERLRNTGAGAIGGGVLGGAIGIPGGAVANQSVVRRAPTAGAVETATDDAYNAMRAADVQFNVNGFDNLVQRIDADLQGQNVGAMTGSTTQRWLGNLQGRVGQAPTLDELDTIRRDIQSDIRDLQRGTNPNGNDIRLLQRMVTTIDDFIADPQAPILRGNLPAAQASLTEGRSLSLASRKNQVLTDAVAAARLTAGERVATPASRQAALANEFQKIARDDAMRRMFNAEELALIDQISSGNITENALRRLGRLSPSNAFGSFGGFLQAGAGLGGVYAGLGPTYAAGAAALGEIGARASGAMTSQNAALAAALARSRGSATANPAILPIIQALTATGASQGIQAPPTQAYLDLLLPPRQGEQIPWRQ
jgi:hypothetical protein